MVLPENSKEETTKSGIILPNQIKEDVPIIGTVVRVGRGDEDRPMRYKVGDIIMTSSYSGIEAEIDLVGFGYHRYKVMNQMDVMGKLKEIKEEK